MKILLKLMEPRSYSPCYSHGKYIALINCWVHFLYSYHSSLLTNYNSELPPLCQFWCTPTQRSMILQVTQPQMVVISHAVATSKPLTKENLQNKPCLKHLTFIYIIKQNKSAFLVFDSYIKG